MACICQQDRRDRLDVAVTFKHERCLSYETLLIWLNLIVVDLSKATPAIRKKIARLNGGKQLFGDNGIYSHRDKKSDFDRVTI